MFPTTSLRLNGSPRPTGDTFDRLRAELHGTLDPLIGHGFDRRFATDADGFTWIASWPLSRLDPARDWPAICAAMVEACRRGHPECGDVVVDYSFGDGAWFAVPALREAA